MKFKNLAQAFIATCFATQAFSADCPLLYDRVSADQSSVAREAVHSSMCSSTYREFNQTFDARAKFQWKLIGGSGSYNKTNYERHQTNTCTAYSKKNYNASSNFYLSETLGKNAVAAYQACIGQTFSCIPFLDGDNVAIELHWRSGNDGRIEEATATNAVILTESVKTGSELRLGTKVGVLSRTDRNTASSIAFNVTEGGNNRSCYEFIPASGERTNPFEEFIAQGWRLRFKAADDGFKFWIGGPDDAKNKAEVNLSLQEETTYYLADYIRRHHQNIERDINNGSQFIELWVECYNAGGGSWLDYELLQGNRVVDSERLDIVGPPVGGVVPCFKRYKIFVDNATHGVVQEKDAS